MNTDQERLKEVAGDGQEPDYRFTLANERTFLAWIRTALAPMAAASPSPSPTWLRRSQFQEGGTTSECYSSPGVVFWRRWQSGAGDEYRPRCAAVRPATNPASDTARRHPPGRDDPDARRARRARRAPRPAALAVIPGHVPGKPHGGTANRAFRSPVNDRNSLIWRLPVALSGAILISGPVDFTPLAIPSGHQSVAAARPGRRTEANPSA